MLCFESEGIQGSEVYMKSSTIRRSTLSKETMEVIENLAKEQEAGGLPNEYVRPENIESSSENSGKSQEIDLLWQTFKTTQFNTNSPIAYIIMGFISGVILTMITMACFGVFANKSNVVKSPKQSTAGIASIFNKNQSEEPTLEEQTADSEAMLENKIPVPDETTALTAPEYQNAKKYVVESGDTGESIVKRFYGTYSPEKAELIIKANNLSNFDKLSIGQELIIPVEE